MKLCLVAPILLFNARRQRNIAQYMGKPTMIAAMRRPVLATSIHACSLSSKGLGLLLLSVAVGAGAAVAVVVIVLPVSCC